MLVPIVIENSSKGERAMDIFSRLLKDRIIFINGEINTQMSHVVCAQLLFAEAEDSDKEVSVYINSPGGEVTAGLAILDTMNFIKCDVRTIVCGQACSMGSLLAQAGTAGKRMILPNARTMCHQPSGGAGGQASDMEIQVAEILKMKRTLTQIYVDHNSKGKTFDELSAMMERDHFMSAQETVDNGFADEIIINRQA